LLHPPPSLSFKERGGLNALLLMDPESRRRGAIAASAGNHALALAYHGKNLGIPITVVMPTIAPITKVRGTPPTCCMLGCIVGYVWAVTFVGHLALAERASRGCLSFVVGVYMVG
jgi:hypothetical protein